MQKNSLLLFFGIFFFFFNKEVKSQNKTDWEHDYLRGRIKHIILIQYKFNENADEIEKVVNYKKTYKYDSCGNQTEIAQYDSVGILIKKTNRKYDLNSNEIQTIE